MEKAVCVVGVVTVIVGIMVMIAGYILIYFTCKEEELRNHVNGVLDRYEDDDSISEEDAEKLDTCVEKSLNGSLLGARLATAGGLCWTMGGMLLILFKVYCMFE